MRSGIFQLAVEMTANPAEKKEDKRKRGSTGRGSEGGGFPALVEMMVECDEDHAKETNEADQGAERHDELAKCLTLTLPRESNHAM